MRLGANLLDGSTTHMPLGWVDGEYVRDENGLIPFANPDESNLGYVSVAGLDTGKQYAVMVDTSLPAHGSFLVRISGVEFETKTTGLELIMISGVAGAIIELSRATADGSGWVRVEIREVLEA